MGNSNNVTITNHRLEEGFKKLIEKTTQIPVSQLQKKVTEESIKIGKVNKIYIGRDTLEIKIGDNKVKCYANYNIFDTIANVSYTPQGNEGKDKIGYYIKPLKTIYCVAAKLSNDMYVNLGFIDRNNSNVNFCRNGELIIQVGDNKISITEDRLNILSDNFFVNGLPFAEPELNNYPSSNNFKWEQITSTNFKINFNKFLKLVNISFFTTISNYTSQDIRILEESIPKEYAPIFDIYSSCNRGDAIIIFYSNGQIGFRCEENFSEENIQTSSLWSIG